MHEEQSKKISKTCYFVLDKLSKICYYDDTGNEQSTILSEAVLDSVEIPLRLSQRKSSKMVERKRKENSKMSARARKMIEDTILNLTYDMDCIGVEAEIFEELARLSDSDLEAVLNQILEELD